MLISPFVEFERATRTDLFEARNRLHIYSRAYCTLCGPRYEPLSRAPFTSRGINLIHLLSFEFACCRSDLFKASWISRLARKVLRKLHRRQLSWRHDLHWCRAGADVVSVIPLLSRHNGPQYSRILVGQSDHRFLPASSLTESLNPQKDRILILASKCNRLGALDEQGTQVNASSLGNTAQGTLTSTRVLLRRQTQPYCELRTVFELSKITHSGNESQCSYRSDAHQFGCTLDLFIIFLVISNTLITPLNMRVKLAPMILCSLQDEASNTRNIIAGIFNHSAKLQTQHLRTLRKYNAKLCQQSAYSVDAGSTLLFETLSESMHTKHALLRQCFRWNKVHMRPRRCLILFCFQRYRCYPIKSGKALHSFGV